MPTKYTWWPAPHSQQALFTHCMIGFADTCEWVMLLDVDEFIWMDALTVRPPSTKASNPSHLEPA